MVVKCSKSVITAIIGLFFLYSCAEKEDEIEKDEKVNYSINDSADAFITIWETTTRREKVIINTNPLVYGYHYLVDWGDGEIDENITCLLYTSDAADD